MAAGTFTAKRLVNIFPFILAIFLQPSPIRAQGDTILEVSIGNHEALPGEQGVVIPIYMKNYQDSIAGFDLWLILDRPDIMEFQITLDRTGTLTEDWEMWGVNTLGGQGHDLTFFEISNFVPPYTHAIGYPQYGEIPLVKVIADVYDIPDTMTDRTVNIFIYRQLDHFGFSDPQGNLIGLVPDSCPDTTWFRCVLWQDTVCLQWEEIPGPPADSFEVTLVPCPYLDTTRVIVTDGSLTVRSVPCGDIDASGGNPNVVDLTYLVNYLFKGGPPPPLPDKANVNGIGGINVADVTYLVDYLFRSGPVPVC
jgi:hypothetical protein